MSLQPPPRLACSSSAWVGAVGCEVNIDESDAVAWTRMGDSHTNATAPACLPEGRAAAKATPWAYATTAAQGHHVLATSRR
ncbi:hypothetical protein DB30_03790 [Enhygromyxa salina]|uniref:Uncharacterized protein n=1 Tax=Enhygromyxa salina TaxID=215803 RepID=A0A0C1ZLA6_9BACT|nr:hypothetical protein [Enhygromyxa salina]KIG11513.1 hypothetical protein DB30_03790 [Enhygromyxa salina]